MSSIGDVIHDSAALVQAFDALLKTETARQAPQIALDLGAKPQFDEAVCKASGVVNTVAFWVGSAWQVATVADAAVAVFGLLPEVARGTSRAIQDAGAQASELELDVGGLRSIADQMSGAVEQVADALQVGVEVADEALAFVAPPQLHTLQLAFERVAEDLAALSAPPAPDRSDTATPIERPELTAHKENA
jgi:hypothetical protein